MINGRYSLLQYSANIGSSIEVTESFDESLRGVSGSAVFIDIVDTFDASAVCYGRITASVITEAEAYTSMHNDVSMVANSVIEESAVSGLMPVVRSSQDIYIDTAFSSDIGSVSYLSVETPAGLEATVSWHSESTVYKDIADLDLYVTDILMATAGGGLVEEAVIIVSVTMQPGSELRIDSENFTVLLDGKNVLNEQSGVWPVLSRNLVQMTVDSGNGGKMSGEMVYTERWL